MNSNSDTTTYPAETTLDDRALTHQLELSDRLELPYQLMCVHA